MNLVVPALLALGVLLVYAGLTSPPTRQNRFSGSLGGLIDEAGLSSLTPAGLLVASAALALTALVLVAGVTGAFVPSVLVALAAAGAPLAYVRTKKIDRRRALREAWPDALASMIAGIRAGMSLPEVCASLAERGAEELRPAFGAFAATYRASGSFSTALQRLRDVLADPVGDRVVAALLLAHEVGGTDLVRVLRTLADFIREDLRIRKEIEARWSWTVTAARVAAASPWIVLLIMSLRPEAAAAYDSPSGGMVVLIGTLTTVVGYRSMLRAARLPEDRRTG